MASVWIETRYTKNGEPRRRVCWHAGGRGARKRYAGTFKRRREAELRVHWVWGELAAGRVPDVRVTVQEPPAAPTLREAAERWRASRVDVSESTSIVHRTALNRALPALGERRVDTIEPQDIAALVADLHGQGKKRESIRKTVHAVAMVLDYAGVTPNPARDKVQVKFPREVKREVEPPTAGHVTAIYGLLPRIHRLPLLFLDWSGARVAAIDKTLVGDYDEPNARVRLSRATTKKGAGIWVELHPALDAAIKASLPPREDRDLEAPLFGESKQTTLRRAMARACQALGIPLFSPHDLRHRRISLLHMRGVPWARIGEQVGQRSLKVTSETYTHVLLDTAEVDYDALLAEVA